MQHVRARGFGPRRVARWPWIRGNARRGRARHGTHGDGALQSSDDGTLSGDAGEHCTGHRTGDERGTQWEHEVSTKIGQAPSDESAGCHVMEESTFVTPFDMSSLGWVVV